MARIRPFRGFRYNPEKVREVNRKFSPLFDVISKEEAAKLYLIPDNSIHLSVPKSQPEAVQKLREWKDKKILLQEALPSIYVYYQEFSLFGESRSFTRKGFVCMIEATDIREGMKQKGIVLHEDTIASSVNDRIGLLQDTLLNVAPTHGLYDDPKFELEKIMDRYMQHPVYNYIDYQGVINKMAIIQDPRDIRPFLQVLDKKVVYMADGHHRYESSRVVSETYRQKGDAVPNSMMHYHLMYLTNLASDDLRILPTHRVVSQVPTALTDSELIQKLETWFYVRESDKRTPMHEEIRPGKNRLTRIGMARGGRRWILDLKPLPNRPKSRFDIPDPVKNLDYTRLHEFVLDNVLGIRYEDQAHSTRLQFIKDISDAMYLSDSDPGKIAFLMNGVTMQEMMAVCNTGAKMPMKATYFYPKVLCGMVFASIADEDNATPFDSGF
jgi:uncharacterized protein (DUF1015 family)